MKFFSALGAAGLLPASLAYIGQKPGTADAARTLTRLCIRHCIFPWRFIRLKIQYISALIVVIFLRNWRSQTRNRWKIWSIVRLFQGVTNTRKTGPFRSNFQRPSCFLNSMKTRIATCNCYRISRKIFSWRICKTHFICMPEKVFNLARFPHYLYHGNSHLNIAKFNGFLGFFLGNSHFLKIA